ncbi:response regulator transcription factor [Sulfitobacter guttiformis]|uniref:LuxR family two component transcriptional regulator n=1 Tax=Sulfitobacter guttiformis TaxID=74349 RepID=A0A420DJ03_9RHOB|nr:DNA-binding response regulator [Sulfitobacter guttiformis]KIN72022.1 Two-component response regulator [Sulfitobacter guttiformis KCTC 32187]RKE94187.1 LuxR family two component transcriptional regulator [Sulfitobacter guttiformis]
MGKHVTADQNIALVVDDDPNSLSMISTALEENGMSVIVARDGRTAIDLVKRVRPDVILMDAVMPDMDGFETCHILKTGPQSTHAPIIFMTGLTEPEDVLRGLAAGGVDYITKPVVVDELVARIGIHVINSKLIQSARDAHDVSGRSLLAFDQSGILVWGSKMAMDTFNLNPVDFQTLQDWVVDCTRKPVFQIVQLTVGGHTFHYVGFSNASEILIKFIQERTETPKQLLARFLSLTLREAEVLYWLTLGKTNHDISVILSLSPRTVNKHLEKIFQKMGVDNRTSAAVAADRILHLN